MTKNKRECKFKYLPLIILCQFCYCCIVILNRLFTLFLCEGVKLFFFSPVLCGGGTDIFFKYPAKIISILKTAFFGDFCDPFVGAH